MIARIESHWEEALKLLLEQYRNSPKFLSILGAVVSGADHVEDLLWTVAYCLDFNLRIADTPTGARLNRIGAVAVVTRLSGELDAAYLQRIRIEIGISDAGTPEEVLRLLRTFSGDATPWYIPEYPAGFFVYAPDATKAITQPFIDHVSPAGVQGYIGCNLVDAHGNPIIDAEGAYILVVGPADEIPVFGSLLTEALELLLTEDDLILLNEDANG